MAAGAIGKQQRFALLALGGMALLAVPLYVIVGIVTIPVGIGLFMLASDSPWVLNLYPFLFAGKLAGRTPHFIFGTSIGALLTLLQWVAITWWFAGKVDEGWSRGRILRRAAGLVALVAAGTWILLHLFGLQAVWSQGARM